MTMATWTGDQTNFRFRTVNAATAAINAAFDGSDPAINTDVSINVDTVFRIRIEVDETAGGSANKTWNLRYQLNGSGGYQVVGTTTPIQLAANSSFADDDATTNLISGSSRAFLAGYGDDTDNVMPSTGNQSWSGTQHTELDICLTIDSAQVSNNDFFDLRIYESNGTALGTYTRTPRITAIESSVVTGSARLLGKSLTNTLGFRIINGSVSLLSSSQTKNLSNITINSTTSFLTNSRLVSNLSAVTIKRGVIKLLSSSNLSSLPSRTLQNSSSLLLDSLSKTDGYNLMQGTSSLKSESKIITIPSLNIRSSSSFYIDSLLKSVAGITQRSVVNILGESDLNSNGYIYIKGSSDLLGQSLLIPIPGLTISGSSNLFIDSLLVSNLGEIVLVTKHIPLIFSNGTQAIIISYQE